jgi:hypothetical protein
MNMLWFYAWCDATWLGQAIRGVTWAFPLIETIHIIALLVLLGGILMVDISLLGGLRRLTPAHIMRQVKPYVNWSLVVILITGVLLFLSEALKAYDNDAFRPKVTLLAMAIIWHYTVHRRAEKSEIPGSGKIAALGSILLWFGVGAAGRAIGFV